MAQMALLTQVAAVDRLELELALLQVALEDQAWSSYQSQHQHIQAQPQARPQSLLADRTRY
jgi:hypothetical protein